MGRREETMARIEAQLGRMDWPTAGEVAREVNLSTGTTRQYLHTLVRDGRADSRQDPDVPTPMRDGGGFRFHRLDPPRPPLVPTDDLLCPACIARDYGNPRRYLLVANRDPQDDAPDSPGEYETYLQTARCDRCGGVRFPNT
jgi:hypothetical protein